MSGPILARAMIPPSQLYTWPPSTATHAIVRLLLQRHDIKPNLRYSGQTPLHAAIFYGHMSIVQLLLEHKAVDRNAKDGYHRTPLSAAIWRSRAKIACLILQQPGIDITWIDCQGRTAASYAAQRGYLGILRALYKRDGTVLDNVNKHGRTLLIWTARNGYAQTAV